MDSKESTENQENLVGVIVPNSAVKTGFAQTLALAKMEITVRLRSTRWIISLLVWAGVQLLMCLGFLSLMGTAIGYSSWAMIYSALVWFTLCVLLAVIPGFSATAINGDRRDATLALLQATPLKSSQIVFAKLFAATGAGTVFLAVALPFQLVTGFFAGVYPLSMAVILLALFFEILVLSSIGIGFSALSARPAASSMLTLLTIVALSVGGPLAFIFTLNTVTERVKVPMYVSTWKFEGSETMAAKPEKPGEESGEEPQDLLIACKPGSYEKSIQHSELNWWLNLSTPFVLVADASASLIAPGDKAINAWEPNYNTHVGEGKDPRPRGTVINGVSELAYMLAQTRFGEARNSAKWGKDAIETELIHAPGRLSVNDQCKIVGGKPMELTEKDFQLNRDFRENFRQSYPDSRSEPNFHKNLGHSWYYTAGLHLFLAAAFLLVAVRRTKVPASKLSRGTRVA